jgi:hypothetical protein
VDGATDFLFVVAVGLLHRAGASLEDAVLGLAVGAQFATLALVYVGLRRVQHGGVLASASTALSWFPLVRSLPRD